MIPQEPGRDTGADDVPLPYRNYNVCLCVCLCCYVFNLVIENKQTTCGSPNILEGKLQGSIRDELVRHILLAELVAFISIAYCPLLLYSFCRYYLRV